MSSKLPTDFRKSGDPVVATYSFYDTFTQTGYKTFYGAQTLLVSTAKYSLLTEAIGTNEIYTDSGANTQLEINYDLDLTMPTVLRGTAYVLQPIGVVTAAGTTTVTIRLLKVDSGGTETQIGGTVSKTYSGGSGGVPYSNWTMVGGNIAVALTSLKAGEKIRIEVISTASGGLSHVYIHHDPKQLGATSGATGQASTAMLAVLPFKLNL